MIVDDEPVVFKVVKEYLKLAGYKNCLTTSESAKAAEIIRRESPDIVLLDIQMPEVSGLDILEEIRASAPTAMIPVIILTACDDQETKQKALNLGATDFLSKPVDPSDLIPRVRNALLVKGYQDHLRCYAEWLEKEVEKRTGELEASRLEVLLCLARAAEFRDNETGRHIIRVGRYVGIIARELGFDEETAELVANGSLLHDVGKIGIKDEILLKPGKLTREEFEVIKSHVSIGPEILDFTLDGSSPIEKYTTVVERIVRVGRSPLLTVAARIASSHHEKWDGSGYPLGLSGEEIPIEGRITAIADVFDALSSVRPYKPAFPLNECLSIIKRKRGRHFDPTVLDAFLARIEEILNVQMELSDVACATL